MKRIALAVAATWLVGSYASAAETYTYLDLVNRLTDLKYLASIPAEGEQCAQWSSYDRASWFDTATADMVRHAKTGHGAYLPVWGERARH